MRDIQGLPMTRTRSRSRSSVGVIPSDVMKTRSGAKLCRSSALSAALAQIGSSSLETCTCTQIVSLSRVEPFSASDLRSALSNRAIRRSMANGRFAIAAASFPLARNLLPSNRQKKDTASRCGRSSSMSDMSNKRCSRIGDGSISGRVRTGLCDNGLGLTLLFR